MTRRKQLMYFIIKKYLKRLFKNIISFTKTNIIAGIIIFVLTLMFFAYNREQTTIEYFKEMYRIKDIGLYVTSQGLIITQILGVSYLTIREAIYFSRAYEKYKAEKALNAKVEKMLACYKAKNNKF